MDVCRRKKQKVSSVSSLFLVLHCTTMKSAFLSVWLSLFRNSKVTVYSLIYVTLWHMSIGCGFSFCPAHGRAPLSFLKAAPCFFVWPARTGAVRSIPAARTPRGSPRWGPKTAYGTFCGTAVPQRCVPSRPRPPGGWSGAGCRWWNSGNRRSR